MRHASASGKEGLAAFKEIVDWKGGVISEVAVPPGIPHTIELDWQVLLMEAVRNIDESRGAEAEAAEQPASTSGYKILVIDDSVMLLSFLEEILTEQGYRVITAESGEEGLKVCCTEAPDLILLDFVLPDMKGDEVCRRLVADEVMGKIPVLYVSGFGSDLQPDRGQIPNVIGSLSKPFTSDSLIKSVRGHLPGGMAEAEKKAAAAPKKTAEPAPVKSFPAPVAVAEEPQVAAVPVYEAPPVEKPSAPVDVPVVASSPAAPPPTAAREPAPNNAYFCGDSSFFSLHWALQTIAREKLTGILRSYWSEDSVELLARNGKVMLVTTHNPALYGEEAPVTLLSVPPEEVEAARARQSEDGCPLFITLAEEGLILREPGLQLVQRYGQKLFSQLWTDRVRFTFEQKELPAFAGDLPISDESTDQWELSTLRFVQFEELSSKTMMESSSIPAYTRDGYERVQQLRLTVAEAQFASQFDGSRSIAQISKTCGSTSSLRGSPSSAFSPSRS